MKIPRVRDLSEIDFSAVSDLRRMVRERHDYLFGAPDDGYIDEYINAVVDLFSGNNPEYQAMDTAYHDITHTLQATLCLVELICHRHHKNTSPRVTPDGFRYALIAILMHDIGFLKKADDREGSGAKYTHLHEQRSCEFARKFLKERDWPDDEIRFVENLISSTGQRADLTKIGFRSTMERLLGQMVCTADYIGQMSDPRYPDRLESLFNEFEESYCYQKIPAGERPFQDFEALLRGTPGFWEFFVKPKLIDECAGVWKHLECPVTGENPYMKSLLDNMATIHERISQLAGPESADASDGPRGSGPASPES